MLMLCYCALDEAYESTTLKLEPLSALSSSEYSKIGLPLFPIESTASARVMSVLVDVTRAGALLGLAGSVATSSVAVSEYGPQP